MTLLERFLERLKEAKKPDLYKESRRGHEAADLLRDGIFTKVIEEMRQKLIDGWQNSPIRDKEGQYELRLMIKVLNDFVGNVEQAYQTGLLAQKELEQQQKEKERKKSRADRF